VRTFILPRARLDRAVRDVVQEIRAVLPVGTSKALSKLHIASPLLVPDFGTLGLFEADESGMRIVIPQIALTLGTLRGRPEAVRSTLRHEFCHALVHIVSASCNLRHRAALRVLLQSFARKGGKPEHFVSAYAHLEGGEEDLAESFAVWLRVRARGRMPVSPSSLVMRKFDAIERFVVALRKGAAGRPP